MRLCLPLILLLFTLNPLWAQRCSDLQDWGERLELEFPSVNWGQVHEGSAASNRALLNLYASPEFADKFGAPFESMSQGKREAAGRKLSKCQNKLDGLQRGTLLYLLYFAVNPLKQAGTGAALQRAAPTLRGLRQEYQAQIKELRSSEPSLNELKRLKGSGTGKYSMLWPSEIDRLTALIDSKQEAAAAKQLLSKAQVLQSLDCKSEILSLYADFATNHADLFALADAASGAEARKVVNDAMDQCLTGLVAEQSKTIANLSDESDDDFNTLLAMELQFTREFQAYASRSDVAAILATIKEKKTAQTLRNKETLSQEIANSNDEEQLRNLIAFIFNLDLSYPGIDQLDRIARNRLKGLEQARLAEQEKARMLARQKQQKVQTAIDANDAEIAAIARRVDALRSSLETKYATRLPTLTQLFYVKTYASAIRSQTDPVDEQRFREYLSDLGYRLSNDGGELFSNRNTFRNSRGYRVKTLRSESRGKTVLLHASLIIDDAPEDIINLYRLELTGLSRNRLKKKREVSPEWPGGDFSLRGYVISGGTTYALELVDGRLTATVKDNSKASVLIYPEEVAPQTLKVTAFTNFTHLEVKKGDRIRFTARGEMRVGLFAGNSTPSGIDRMKLYNLTSSYPHAALIGRIENGPYFMIGTDNTITADRDGIVKLYVNDKDRTNNDGAYYVTYERL